MRDKNEMVVLNEKWKVISSKVPNGNKKSILDLIHVHEKACESKRRKIKS